jgi:hypothetical protein
MSIQPLDACRQPRRRIAIALCGMAESWHCVSENAITRWSVQRSSRFGNEEPSELRLKQSTCRLCRGVAQPGRASGSGPEGRWFESSRPDFLSSVKGKAAVC